MVVRLRFAIRQDALAAALHVCRNVYPDEFIGLFKGSSKDGWVLAEELIVAPGATYGPDSSSFSDWLMPIGSNVVASVHSHPDDEPLPSEEDLEFFGHHAPFHLIVASPYRLRDVRVYNAAGESVSFEVVP